jgi:hypothetical protein
MDTMGADAGIIKPLTWPQPTSPGKLLPYYGVPELNSATDGCVLDGIPVTCDSLTSENSKQCTQNQCTAGSFQFRAFADGYSGYLPSDARYSFITAVRWLNLQDYSRSDKTSIKIFLVRLIM